MLNLEKLRKILFDKKANNKLSLRKIAAESGVSAPTLSRFINGDSTPDTRTVSLLINWLGLSMDELFKNEKDLSADSTNLDLIVSRIKADQNISQVDAEVLSDMFKVLYERFAKK